MRTGYQKFVVPLFIGLLGCSSAAVFRDPKVEAQKWVVLAEASLVENDPAGAFQALVKAEELEPSLASLHHARALAYLMKSDLSMAFDSAKKARGLDPQDSAIRTTYGKILMDLKRYREAEEALLASARDPLYRDAYRARTNLALLNLNRGDSVQAQLHLDRAIQEAPELACVAYFLRGKLSLKQGRFRDAIQDFEKSTKRLCSGYGEAALSLGNALVADKQYQRARRQFLEVQDRFPGTQWEEDALQALRSLP